MLNRILFLFAFGALCSCSFMAENNQTQSTANPDQQNSMIEEESDSLPRSQPPKEVPHTDTKNEVHDALPQGTAGVEAGNPGTLPAPVVPVELGLTLLASEKESEHLSEVKEFVLSISSVELFMTKCEENQSPEQGTINMCDAEYSKVITAPVNRNFDLLSIDSVVEPLINVAASPGLCVGKILLKLQSEPGYVVLKNSSLTQVKLIVGEARNMSDTIESAGCQKAQGDVRFKIDMSSATKKELSRAGEYFSIQPRGNSIE